ncbi:hypothetical protein CYLTODRAFT_420052 [Cylindrobasidium torrendii FP15055 ss-10]|uniref:Uncharacterized protein n=1 Tax=Cylindrobasidium torrendii FP15055 ss-10 TaxID=1314674 RepID=A0A0D7BJ03_9AGAR|nr:hypothetical protein CYLTODRAFT_420052 [Cylindrobasidium torrendii FP15055 ss-10]
MLSALELPQAERRISKLPDAADTPKRETAQGFDIITPANEQFIRTYHPAFERAPDVYVCKIVGRVEDSVWVVSPEHLRTTEWFRTHFKVAGREVHEMGISATLHLTHRGFQSGLNKSAIIGEPINTRRILDPSHIQMIRGQFPEAIGVRIFVGGYLCLLVKTPAEMKEIASRPWPPEMGSLKVQLELWADRPKGGSAPLGLRLQGIFNVDGKERDIEVVTAPTNVHAVRPSEMQKSFTSYFSATTIHMFHRPLASVARSISAGLPTLASRVQTSCSPLGMPALCEGKEVGNIIKCYEDPSALLPFPFRYRHNISFVSGADVPSSYLPQGVPRITGYASFEDALAPSATIFTVRCHPTKASVRSRAIVEGHQYVWDVDPDVWTSSLLWRTLSDHAQVEGADTDDTGCMTLLCLGDVEDRYAKIVAFQSFETTLPTANVRARAKTASGLVEALETYVTRTPAGQGTVWYGGGFELPEDILAAEVILSEEQACRTQLGTTE